jgi:uncharacterized protein YozE (UPF0346 family)
MNKSFYNFEKIEERGQKKFKKIIAHNIVIRETNKPKHTEVTNEKS